MKKILPLGEPPIISYLFHLYPLAILATDDAYLPWLYSTHIQLFVFPGEALKFFVHPLSTSHRLSHAHRHFCPLLDLQGMDGEAMAAICQDFPAAFMRLIDREYYVQADVDYFYLPDRGEYRRRHFLHELLLFGYDDGEEVFATLGFDRHGRCAPSQVKFAELAEALATPKERFFEEAASAPPWFAESLADRPRIFLYRYLRDQQCFFDLPGVIEQLTDYLEARNTSERFRLVALPRPGGAWGMAIYGFLREAIGRLQDEPEEYSPIPLRLLWEHKRCMLGRLAYLEDQGYLDRSEGWSTQYGPVENLANSLRLLMLRWAAAQKPTALAEAQALLSQLEATERPVLEAALRRLRSWL